MGFTPDSSGKPVYDDNADPRPDFQGAVDYAAVFAHLRVGTAAQRTALSPGQLHAGLQFYETDTDSVYRWNSGWSLWSRGWTAYTPTTSGFTGTVAASYKVSQGEVTVRIRASITDMTGNPTFSLPVNASDGLLEHAMGTVALIPAAGSEAPGIVRRNSSSQVVIYAQQVSGANVFLNNITSSVPFASWASGIIAASFAYRAA